MCDHQWQLDGEPTRCSRGLENREDVPREERWRIGISRRVLGAPVRKQYSTDDRREPTSGRREPGCEPEAECGVARHSLGDRNEVGNGDSGLQFEDWASLTERHA